MTATPCETCSMAGTQTLRRSMMQAGSWVPFGHGTHGTWGWKIHTQSSDVGMFQGNHPPMAKSTKTQSPECNLTVSLCQPPESVATRKNLKKPLALP